MALTCTASMGPERIDFLTVYSTGESTLKAVRSSCIWKVVVILLESADEEFNFRGVWGKRRLIVGLGHGTSR